MANKFKEFLESSKRILLIAKKPSNKEFWAMAKVVGLGMIVIGVIGFIVRLIMNIISGAVWFLQLEQQLVKKELL